MLKDFVIKPQSPERKAKCREKASKQTVNSPWTEEEKKLLSYLYKRIGPNAAKIKKYFNDKTIGQIKKCLDKIQDQEDANNNDSHEFSVFQTDSHFPFVLQENQDHNHDQLTSPATTPENQSMPNIDHSHQEDKLQSLTSQSLHFTQNEGKGDDGQSTDNELIIEINLFTFTRRAITIQSRIKNYKYSGELNRGTFSTVVLLYDYDTKKEFAGKVMLKSDLIDKDSLDVIESELIIKNLNHVNIIKFHDFIELDDKYILVTEYCPNGDLLDFKAGSYFNESYIPFLINQMVEAVYYLHFNKIVHNDIKLENFLLDDKMNLKLADFGFAQSPSVRKDKIGFSQGYAPPEVVFDPKNVDLFKLDIYELGKTIEKLTMETSFYDKYNYLVQKCLKNQNERATIQKVRKYLNPKQSKSNK